MRQLKNYIEGNWETAFEGFKEALILDPNDGPSKTLFKYIKDKGCIKLDNWDGARELTSK